MHVLAKLVTYHEIHTYIIGRKWKRKMITFMEFFEEGVQDFSNVVNNY